ncbi:parapinopsin-like [Hydractinia symbiolongicarpus]|uniref:parapinopsin-like n=1 Tax=Hydractinia symbiolongicarpus TaxID=13093 RepID=UPI00254DE0A9|nr:parapinopsin-like [Hydractinia symbiolongicarpus]
MEKVEEFETAMLIVIVVLIVFATIFNLFIITALTRSYHRRKYRDYILISAAFCDLTRILLVGSLEVRGLADQELSHGRVACILEAFFMRFFEFSSICHIFALAIDRYLCSIKQNYALVLYTKTLYIPLSLLLIYGYAFLWSVLPVFGLGRYDKQSGNIQCGLVPYKNSLGKIYMTLVLTFVFVLPISIICITALKIMKHIRTNFNSRVSCASRASTKSISQVDYITEDIVQVRLVIATTITFVLTWLPYDLTLAHEIYTGESANEYVEVTMTVIGQTSALIMPLIYIVLYKDLRRTIRTMRNNVNSFFCKI